MCGIAGILTLKGGSPDHQLLAEMNSLLAHRGPDGHGIEVVDGLGITHCRLSIIDFDGGHQPMYSSDGRCLISFNGEIFNYLELKEELRHKGVVFRSNSDTEVLLEGFQLEGVNFLKRVNGQFAFAFYSIDSRVLYLARDRMGEKPLYYACTDNEIIFASEMKSVMYALRRKGLRLSSAGLSSYLSLNYVPNDQTLIEGILNLPPATVLSFSEGKATRYDYWSSGENYSCEEARSVKDVCAELLDSSVSLRLRSDAPVGMFLSGGIDSSLLAYFLARRSSRVKAFIADFAEAGFSEAENAIEVCRSIGIPYEIVPISFERENIPSLIERLVWHCDEPLADSSALPVFLLSRYASKQVKVVLTGDGGDELFGGYLTYRATLLAKRIPKILRQIGSLFAFIPRIFPASNNKVVLQEKLDRFLRSLHLPPGAAHFAWNGMFSAEDKRALLLPNVVREEYALESFRVLAENLSVELDNPELSSLMLADQKNYLPNDILSKVDRMTMAHGLEARPFFLDHNLVEFSRSLQNAQLANLSQGKILLREILKERIPNYNTRQKKQGFSIPIHNWFRTVLREFAGDLFSSELTLFNQVFEQKELLRIWDLHQKRKINVGFEMWGIMILLLWSEKFFPKPSRSSA